MKTVSAVLAGVAALVTLGVALESGGDPDGNMRVGYFANVGHAVPIVGVESGMFEAGMNGAGITARVFDSGPQVIESMFAGSIDLAYVGPGPAINGFLNSEDGSIRILAGAASGGASLVAHPDSDMDAGIAGKRIAAPQIGNTQDVSLRYYLEQNGERPAETGGSVTVYNVPNPDIYTLFAKGEIDAAWVAEPWASVLEYELGGERILYEEELWPEGRFASVLLIADMGYVERNPGVVSDFLAVHHETVEWVDRHPVETRVIFNGFLSSYLGAPLPDEVVDTALSNMRVTADPMLDSVHTFAERADSLGYLGRNGYDLAGILYEHDYAAEDAA